MRENELELEADLVATMLLDPDIVDLISIMVKPSYTGNVVAMFEDKRNELIVRAILTLRQRGEDIELLTVRDLLRKEGKLKEAGGAEYMVLIVERFDCSMAEPMWHAMLKKYADYYGFPI